MPFVRSSNEADLPPECAWYAETPPVGQKTALIGVFVEVRLPGPQFVQSKTAMERPAEH